MSKLPDTNSHNTPSRESSGMTVLEPAGERGSSVASRCYGADLVEGLARQFLQAICALVSTVAVVLHGQWLSDERGTSCNPAVSCNFVGVAGKPMPLLLLLQQVSTAALLLLLHNQGTS
jgi:hypothetical protein